MKWATFFSSVFFKLFLSLCVLWPFAVKAQPGNGSDLQAFAVGADPERLVSMEQMSGSLIAATIPSPAARERWGKSWNLPGRKAPDLDHL